MELGLVETVEALRAELAATARAADPDLSFEIEGVQLTFHVAVKKEAKADAKVKFWVVEAGAAAGLSREEVHTVTVTLGAPTDAAGRPLRIAKGLDVAP